MAHVQYADMIKTVSGALTKINKKSQHASEQKMILATHRTAPSTSTQCSRIYLRGLSSVTHSTPLTQKELSVRAKFSAVATAVSARAKDMSKTAQDYEAYIAQKDLPNGKKTMRAYLWKLESEAYDEAHS